MSVKPEAQPPRFFIRTYGCQMNERDSESAAMLLRARGFVEVAAEAEADILLINTCSVRGKAESKALGKAGLAIAGKAHRPGRVVGLIGCMVQRRQADLFRKLPGLDFAVGTQRLPALPDVVARVLAGETPILESGAERLDPDALAQHAPGAISVYINILFGCNRGCAYCVVPQVRGREWSRPAERILAEVRTAVSGGAREIVLLGQSVMSYGRSNAAWGEDQASPRGFTEPLTRLLEAVNDVPGVARIRFTSGHPGGCTGELARAMGALPAVCEHLHLPVQSGSDRILARMRRGYTADEYRAAVARLRARVPGLALTTDVIVGFPSETEADFEQTRRLLDEIGFLNAFIFKYSPRPDTPAAGWQDDVPEAEKQRRNRVLLEDQDQRGTRINQALNGRTMEVLVEGVSLRNRQRWAGRTRTNQIAVFHPPAGIRAGDLVQVAVERVQALTLFGKVIDGR